MRRLSARLVENLTLPPGGGDVVPALGEALSRVRGRPVRLRAAAFPPLTASGLWVDRVDHDLIVYEENTEPEHQLVIIGHEAWHMFQGHCGGVTHHGPVASRASGGEASTVLADVVASVTASETGVPEPGKHGTAENGPGEYGRPAAPGPRDPGAAGSRPATPPTTRSAPPRSAQARSTRPWSTPPGTVKAGGPEAEAVEAAGTAGAARGRPVKPRHVASVFAAFPFAGRGDTREGEEERDAERFGFRFATDVQRALHETRPPGEAHDLAGRIQASMVHRIRRI
ncbi:hypothetical protein JS756_04440 [Streptomyces actuosus]|uniref:Toxin-antitoxin system, toxin component n=1 Tax=Streptomyces actuosus TaxID=1885 RepID=A0ABS2VJT1_STRAS|nr:hypothetical protein [Streptomyces actuosus]